MAKSPHINLSFSFIQLGPARDGRLVLEDIPRTFIPSPTPNSYVQGFQAHDALSRFLPF